MTLNRKHKIFIGAAVVVAAAGGGVAVAASQATSPGAESKAVIDDAAKQLGIPSAKLSDALKTALADRVDAAVAAGRITKGQGDAMKQRIQSGDFPVLGGFHDGGFGHHDGLFLGLDPAASYIGVTEAQLRTELGSGKTLAQVAKAHGKTADGLVAALRRSVEEQTRRSRQCRPDHEGSGRSDAPEPHGPDHGSRQQDGSAPASGFPQARRLSPFRLTASASTVAESSVSLVYRGSRRHLFGALTSRAGIRLAVRPDFRDRGEEPLRAGFLQLGLDRCIVWTARDEGQSRLVGQAGCARRPA